MRILSILSILFIGVLGCAVLNQPTFEVTSSRLTSETNPQLVDGNLDTISTFAVRGHLEKSYKSLPGENRTFGNTQRKYMTQVEGSRRTEAVIKLDAPTYISYVEIYPASRIPKLALMTTLEDPKFASSFNVVHDKLHTTLEGKRPVRFQINRKILYLRLTADGIEDRQNAIREKKEKNERDKKKEKIDIDARIQIPLKGASIREVKFYAR
ncbi:hypothetical protein J4G08_19860 [Candidatus Poribacteria bacterium]|nr:hypothetical protein [Candidatus Poribacteria bacterium]